MLVQCLTPKIDITWIAYRYKIVPGLQSCVRWLITAVQNGVTTQIMKVAMCAYVFAEARNVPLDANLSRWPNITSYKFDCTRFFYHEFYYLPCIIKHTIFKKEQGSKTVAGSWHFFCLYRKLLPNYVGMKVAYDKHHNAGAYFILQGCYTMAHVMYLRKVGSGIIAVISWPILHTNVCGDMLKCCLYAR